MSPIRPLTAADARKAPDFAAIKQRQQATWASGDFSVVAARIQYQAEQLCETVDLQAGWRVLATFLFCNHLQSLLRSPLCYPQLSQRHPPRRLKPLN